MENAIVAIEVGASVEPRTKIPDVISKAGTVSGKLLRHRPQPDNWKIIRNNEPIGEGRLQKSLQISKVGKEKKGTAEIFFEKGVDEQFFSNSQISSINFTSKDGTNIAIIKGNGGEWEVSIKDEKLIKELDSFLKWLNLDMEMKNIFDTVIPADVRRTLTIVGFTTLAIAGTGRFAMTQFGPKEIYAETMRQLVAQHMVPPAIGNYLEKKQVTHGIKNESNISVKRFSPLAAKNPELATSFAQSKLELIANPDGFTQQSLTVLDNLQTVSGFFDKNVVFKSGKDEASAIRLGLLEQTDSSGKPLYESPIGSGKFSKNIEEAIANIAQENFPYSQQSIYDLLQAILGFNGVQLITPQEIIQQAGILNGGKDISASTLYQAFTSNESLFNSKGSIKGKWYLREAIPGDQIATEDGLSGVIISVCQTPDGKDVRVIFEEINAETGEMQIVEKEGKDLTAGTIVYTRP